MTKNHAQYLKYRKNNVRIQLLKTVQVQYLSAVLCSAMCMPGAVLQPVPPQAHKGQDRKLAKNSPQLHMQQPALVQEFSLPVGAWGSWELGLSFIANCPIQPKPLLGNCWA
jgi:hypothetical protein